MAGYSVNGIDLDSLLDPIGNATPGANTGFTIQGNDLGSVYAPASAGAAYGTTNFFSTSVGSDIGQLFAAAGTVPVPAISAYTVFGFTDVAIASPDAYNTLQVPKVPIRFPTQTLSSGGQLNFIDTNGNLFNYGNIVGNSLTANYGIFQGFSSFRSTSIAPGTQPYPIQIPGKVTTSTDDSYKKYSTSINSVLFIDNNNLLWAWGNGINGVLGTGSTAWASSPVQIGTSSWNMVSCGANFTGAIRSDNTLWTWGLGTSGVLGVGSTTSYSSPVQVGSANNWVTVNSGKFNMAAINDQNQLYIWGSGLVGMLARGNTTNSSTPVQVSGNWVDVGLADSHVVAVKDDGTLWGWGQNSSYELGQGQNTTLSYLVPVQMGSANNWIRANSDKTVFLRPNLALQRSYMVDSNNDLYVCGTNQTYQLGTGDTVSVSIPTQVASNVKFVSGISTGSGNIGGAIYSDLNSTAYLAGSVPLAIGMTSTTSLYTTWTEITQNSIPQLRQLTRMFDSLTPSTTWKSIQTTVSPFTVQAIKSDNTLWNYGLNSIGSLGDGTTTDSSSFTQLGTNSWKMVSTGLSGSVLAIRDDFTLWAWGNNFYGQLGDGTQINQSSPVQIGSSSWNMVSTGDTTYAIRSDRTLWSWGRSVNGAALGDGTLTDRSSPVQIGTDYWQYVSSRGTGAWVIRMDGLLFGWGTNTSGSLGDGTASSKTLPTQIGNNIWKFVNGSASSSQGIDANNKLFTWGAAVTLGTGGASAVSSPVQVGSSSWVAVASRNNGMVVGILSDNTLYAWGNGVLYSGLGGGAMANVNSPVQIGFNNTNQQGNAYYAVSAGPSDPIFAYGTPAG